MPSINSKFCLQISILVIIFCFLTGLILLYCVYPIINKIHHQSYNYAISSHQIKDLTNRQYQIEKTLNKIKQIQRDGLLDRISIKSESSLIKLVKIIEKISTQYQLQESLHWLGKDKIQQKYSVLKFQIQIKGNFKNILKFIQEIENIAIPIEIQKMSINHNQNNKNSQASANITFTLPGEIIGKI